MQCNSYDTQANESINNIIAIFAPKRKTYSKTKSLAKCVMISVGIKNLVQSKFQDKVQNRLKIPVLQPLSSFLEKRENHRNNQSRYIQNLDIKARHKVNIYANMKAEVDNAGTDIAKRGATYDIGQGVDARLR